MRFSIIALFSLASVAFTQSSSSVVSIATAPGIETNVTSSSTRAIVATPTANITGSLSSVLASASSAVSSAIANATSNHPLPLSTGNSTIPAIIGGNSTLGNGTVGAGGNGTSTSAGGSASASTSAKSSADKLVFGGLLGLVGSAVGVLFV